jgi:hypothetical protein
MQARHEGLKGLPRDEVLATLEREGAAYREYLAGLTPEQLAKEIAAPWANLPLWQFAAIFVNELVLHHWDLRAVNDPDARLSEQAAPFLAGMLVPAMPLLAVGEKTDGIWQLDIAGPHGTVPVTLEVRGEQVTPRQGPAPSPAARLGLDADTFVRFIWGRLDLEAAIASGRVSVTGDRDSAQALAHLFPGV